MLWNRNKTDACSYNSELSEFVKFNRYCSHSVEPHCIREQFFLLISCVRNASINKTGVRVGHDKTGSENETLYITHIYMNLTDFNYTFGLNAN